VKCRRNRSFPQVFPQVEDLHMIEMESFTTFSTGRFVSALLGFPPWTPPIPPPPRLWSCAKLAPAPLPPPSHSLHSLDYDD
jgi:hypothetical protein